jgi:hypothetical protein
MTARESHFLLKNVHEAISHHEQQSTSPTGGIGLEGCRGRRGEKIQIEDQNGFALHAFCCPKASSWCSNGGKSFHPSTRLSLFCLIAILVHLFFISETPAFFVHTWARMEREIGQTPHKRLEDQSELEKVISVGCAVDIN